MQNQKNQYAAALMIAGIKKEKYAPLLAGLGPGRDRHP